MNILFELNERMLTYNRNIVFYMQNEGMLLIGLTEKILRHLV